MDGDDLGLMPPEEYEKWLEKTGAKIEQEELEAKTQKLRKELEEKERDCKIAFSGSPDLSQWEEDSRLDDTLESMGEPDKILPLLDRMRSLYPDRDRKGILNPQRFPDQYEADLVEQMRIYDPTDPRMSFANDLLDIQNLFKKQNTVTETE